MSAPRSERLASSTGRGVLYFLAIPGNLPGPSVAGGAGMTLHSVPPTAKDQPAPRRDGFQRQIDRCLGIGHFFETFITIEPRRRWIGYAQAKTQIVICSYCGLTPRYAEGVTLALLDPVKVRDVTDLLYPPDGDRA